MLWYKVSNVIDKENDKKKRKRKGKEEECGTTLLKFSILYINCPITRKNIQRIYKEYTKNNTGKKLCDFQTKFPCSCHSLTLCYLWISSKKKNRQITSENKEPSQVPLFLNFSFFLFILLSFSSSYSYFYCQSLVLLINYQVNILHLLKLIILSQRNRNLVVIIID